MTATPSTPEASAQLPLRPALEDQLPADFRPTRCTATWPFARSVDGQHRRLQCHRHAATIDRWPAITQRTGARPDAADHREVYQKAAGSCDLQWAAAMLASGVEPRRSRTPTRRPGGAARRPAAAGLRAPGGRQGPQARPAVRQRTMAEWAPEVRVGVLDRRRHVHPEPCCEAPDGSCAAQRDGFRQQIRQRSVGDARGAQMSAPHPRRRLVRRLPSGASVRSDTARRATSRSATEPVEGLCRRGAAALTTG